MISSLLLCTLLEQINVLFIGQIGNTEQLAAVGLGNLVIYLFCSALTYGITGTLETFASHAAGRGDIRDCGLYLHRCMLIMTIAYIPITFALLNTESILVCIGMNANISKIAYKYVVIQIPGLYIQALFSSFEAVFSVINYSYIVLIINLAILPFHCFFLYLFVVRWDMEISGCAYSFDISMGIAFLMCLVFASYLEGFKDAWYFPTYQTFRNLREYITLVIPSVVMLFLDYFNWEIMMIMAGMMKNANILASQVIISTVGNLLLMIPYGLSIGAVAVIGTALGANKPELAKKNIYMVSVTSSVIGALFCLILITLPSQIIFIYDDSPSVEEKCLPAFRVFAVAVFFDWS